ncbi:MAG: hypothetical protein AEth_01137 [Candidatus Argoarchaeum ethanivorans]|uniref:Uncharacterized protein n=1 Tax=Candidatus Argoarchaeum ethanivorans TaxID=2608793 RepID=A0A8B3S3E1_9EURY|nr:MAG: hypothetical protein AEth_01137 [Candidatus Argoarchaeum ethanivorans]
MDAEDLLYDLTGVFIDDFEALLIYKGIEPNIELRNQIRDFRRLVSEKTNNSKIEQEKRALNSLNHYLNALIWYYDYWNVIDRSEQKGKRGMHSVLKEGDNSKNLKSKLNYILEELNKGRELLDPKEDVSSIIFFDDSIDYIQKYEVDRINSIEKDEIERIEREKSKKEIEKENKIREKKLAIFCGKGFIVGGLFGFIINNDIITDYVHILLYILISFLVIKFIIIDVKEGYQRDDRWANFISFGIFLIIALIILSAIIFWIFGMLGIDNFISMGLLFIIISYYYGIIFKDYKSPFY